MEFNILGTTAVLVDRQAVRLGPTNRRALLSLLIVEKNRPVSTERLLDALSQQDEPRPPATALRSHLAQLRKALGPGRLRTVAGGYLLSVKENEVDADCFQTELNNAQVAMEGGDPRRAATELEQGLARWRGPCLLDAGGAAWSVAEAERLNELHLVAEETLLDVRLALGENDAVVQLAQVAIRAAPHRESVLAGLMLALYRTGRSAEAVRAYQQSRSALAADGRTPSVELVKLERAILLRDPILDNAQRPKVLTPGTATTMTTDRTLPGGVVTFLMTDVVGSTRLWETAPAAMRVALARHDELIKVAVESHDGVLVRERGEGDSTFSVFRRATDAAASALAAQLSLHDEQWPPSCLIRVRMAMHTGEASERDGDYYGRPVNRVARLRAIAEGGEILVSQSAAEILLDHLPAEASLTALGVKELRDFDRPETVYLLGFDRPGLGSLVRIPPVEEAGAMEASVLEEHADDERSETAISWHAVVEADLAYYEQCGDKDVPFPQDLDRRVIPLTEQTILIGRPSSAHDTEPGIDLSRPFEDPGASRLHAMLERLEDGSYALVDPGSTNGTFLNNMDHPVTRRMQIALISGDCIYLGLWTRIQIHAAGSS